MTERSSLAEEEIVRGASRNPLKDIAFLYWGRIPMVWVITFLTLANIALGYGLAVYVNRNFGTLNFVRHKKRQASQATLVEAQQVVESSPEVSSLPPSATKPAVEPTVSSTESKAQPAGSSPSEIMAGETVDEENVLAGIEEFRSQLAKMSESTEPLAVEPERELIEAAN